MEFCMKWVHLIVLICMTWPLTLLSSKLNLYHEIYGAHHHPNGFQVDEFKCTKSGFFPFPENKEKFYECVQLTATPPYWLSYAHTCSRQECFDIDHPLKCSKESCAKNISMEDGEQFQCLKSNLGEDAQLTCLDETLEYLERLKPRMIEFIAFRGDASENLKLSLRDANLEMRGHFRTLIENTGKNTYPLMIVTDSEPDYLGVGGVYKVYLKGGEMKRIAPVGPTFEIFKSLSHVIVAVFSIVAPYFHNPNSINWQPPLRNFQGRLKEIEHLLLAGETDLSASEKNAALTISTKTISYIDKAISNNSSDMIQYQTYARDLAPAIEESMKFAAEAHARDTIPAMQRLKDEMGEVEWRKLHVIIPTFWPTSLYNIRLQVLEKFMSFDQLKSQVIITEGVRTEDEAKEVLGRVIADRAMAQVLYGGMQDQTMKDHLYSLSTRRDLLSRGTERELDEACQGYKENNKPSCPFSGSASSSNSRFVTMLRL